MIDEPTFAHKTFVFSVAGAALFITIMFFYGIVSLVILRPERNAEIAELQTQGDAWQARAKELEKAIEGYKVAMNFEQLFLLLADHDLIIEMGELENYIKNKAEFCLKESEQHKNEG